MYVIYIYIYEESIPYITYITETKIKALLTLSLSS